MASQAQNRFSENSSDVTRLIEIHKEVAGDKPGRKSGVEALNKSAVVLTSAAWEAFVEDLCREAAEHLVLNLSSPSDLPIEPRRRLSLAVKKAKDELSAWRLAGDGWQEEYRQDVKQLTDGLVGGLNTPKSEQVRSLFRQALGIDDITEAWTWTNMDPPKACTYLDEFVTLRGSIAHRSAGLKAVQKKNSKDFLSHATRLVKATDDFVNNHVSDLTGKTLY